jgi:hypothetical protein
MEPPNDPYIYHHKWLFVADDYDGFDVEESKARSDAWLALPEVDKSRIGRACYWHTHVVPRLDEQAATCRSSGHGSSCSAAPSRPRTWRS